MKLILSGDLHLGRTSTRVPERWQDRARSLYAWRRLVDATVEARADALLLSGDVIDASNRFWETSGPFEEGVRALKQAGIPVVVICGNHDASVLPSIARGLEHQGLKLLGAGGTWERLTLEQNGHPRLHLDGWSFPSETVFEDPLLSYQPPVADGTPVLGMVHGDPGVADSRYAPLSRDRLRSAPVNGWLLGHIHAPSLEAGPPWVLMPGSPHPLDPGEPGAHQAWTCEVHQGVLGVPTPFCPADLRYEEIRINITPEDSPGADLIRSRLRQAVDALRFEGRLVLRVILEGSTRHPEALAEAIAPMREESESDPWTVDQVSNRVHPVLDLEALRKTGPVQELLVQALTDTPPGLNNRLQHLVSQINEHPYFTDKGLSPLTVDDLPVEITLETLLRHSLPDPSA